MLSGLHGKMQLDQQALTGRNHLFTGFDLDLVTAVLDNRVERIGINHNGSLAPRIALQFNND